MKKSLMSYSTMVSLYLEYSLDEDTWDMLYQMACHKLIDADTWAHFSTVCGSWIIDDETSTIRNGSTWEVVAALDENGYWKRT